MVNFLVKQNKLTFGSIEVKTPKQLFKDLFSLVFSFLHKVKLKTPRNFNR
jgi:hypothetical protein